MGDFGAIGAWLLLAVVIVGAVLIAVGTVQLGSRVLSDDTGPEHNSALSPYVTVVGLVYGALLGFTVVVGWQEFLSAEVNVSNEASTLTTMYRQTVAMPQPEQSQIREQLRQYAEGTQGPEWGKQDFGRISNRGRAAITGMYRIVGGQQSNAASSPISQDFLGRLTALASERSTRILDAKPRIPPLLWCSLIFGGLVLITLTGFLRLASNRGHMVLTSTVAVLLGLLLFLVFVLDHPFGPLGVTSQPFAHAVAVFDEVDRGT
ncbi:DUF4239 domain-containing protein [Mycobacterium sp. E796]|uniref:bestrophin-like domain n=1 Tax=Mycobacterium sp. E796 TaxID=1834151 RepID=UPI0007FCE7DC|nr:DUF4239 domain-containing protein [Mycobacterium sp. E796]OBI46314.1 hypothetical protein A5706_29705 [Mycobacterium sp. E796]